MAASLLHSKNALTIRLLHKFCHLPRGCLNVRLSAELLCTTHLANVWYADQQQRQILVTLTWGITAACSGVMQMQLRHAQKTCAAGPAALLLVATHCCLQERKAIAKEGLKLDRKTGADLTPAVWDQFYRFYRNTTGDDPSLC